MAEDQGEADHVYDFLYVDTGRIGLFLSQFGENGLLREIVRETSSGSASGRGVDFKIVKIDSKDDDSRKLTRRFDTQWLLPLLFLDAVQDRLTRTMHGAHLGDFVLIEGFLSIVDISLLQQLYARAPMQKVAIRKAQEKAKAAGETFDRDAAGIELDAIASIAPQLQMHFHSDAGTTWSTLRPDSLITPAAELMLKHGSLIDGRWKVLGIKDAEPSISTDQLEGLDQILIERLKEHVFVSEAVGLSGALRRAFGRPIGWYGMLPLLIFRSVDADPADAPE